MSERVVGQVTSDVQMEPGVGVGDEVDDVQALEPYLGAGWFTSELTGGGPPAQFYRHGGRVWFSGVITYNASAPGANPGQPISSMPDGYRPAGLFNATFRVDPDNTGDFDGTAALSWVGEFQIPGSVELDQHPDFMGSPDFGMPPDGTALILDCISYRAAG